MTMCKISRGAELRLFRWSERDPLCIRRASSCGQSEPGKRMAASCSVQRCATVCLCFSEQLSSSARWGRPSAVLPLAFEPHPKPRGCAALELAEDLPLSNFGGLLSDVGHGLGDGAGGGYERKGWALARSSSHHDAHPAQGAALPRTIEDSHRPVPGALGDGRRRKGERTKEITRGPRFASSVGRFTSSHGQRVFVGCVP
jgi:hypothetical protein